MIICLHAPLKQIAPVQTKDEQLRQKDDGVVSTAGSIFYFHSPRVPKCLLIARLHNSAPWPINLQRYKPRRLRQIRRAALFVTRGDENLTKICNAVLIHTIIIWRSCSASYAQGLIGSFQGSI